MHGSHKRGRCTARVQRVQRGTVDTRSAGEEALPFGQRVVFAGAQGGDGPLTRWLCIALSGDKYKVIVTCPFTAEFPLHPCGKRTAGSGQQKAVLPHPSTFFTASSRFPVKSIFPKREERGSFSLKSERRQNSAFPSLRHRSNTWPPTFLSSER